SYRKGTSAQGIDENDGTSRVRTLGRPFPHHDDSFHPQSGGDGHPTVDATFARQSAHSHHRTDRVVSLLPPLSGVQRFAVFCNQHLLLQGKTRNHESKDPTPNTGHAHFSHRRCRNLFQSYHCHHLPRPNR